MTLPTYLTDPSGRSTEPTWPALMPGADDDPHGERGQAAALLDDASTDIADVSPVLQDAALPESVRQLARQATNAIGEVRRHVHGAVARLDTLASDDLMNPAGRDRLARETQQAAGGAVRDLGSRTGQALAELEDGLTAAAQPSFPAGADRGEARERFRLLVDAATDPAAMVRELVTDPAPELAAVAASPYARDYLRSRGVPAEVIRATAAFAAQAALNSDDPKRQAAARALTKLPELRKARMKALTAANFAIGWQS